MPICFQTCMRLFMNFSGQIQAVEYSNFVYLNCSCFKNWSLHPDFSQVKQADIYVYVDWYRFLIQLWFVPNVQSMPWAPSEICIQMWRFTLKFPSLNFFLLTPMSVCEIVCHYVMDIVWILFFFNLPNH